MTNQNQLPIDARVNHRTSLNQSANPTANTPTRFLVQIDPAVSPVEVTSLEKALDEAAENNLARMGGDQTIIVEVYRNGKREEYTIPLGAYMNIARARDMK